MYGEQDPYARYFDPVGVLERQDQDDLGTPVPPAYMVPEECWTSQIKTSLECLTDLYDHTVARIDRNAELHRMPYRAYLASPEWKEVRRLAVRRRGYRCEHCGRLRRSIDLNVHHLTYERRGYEQLEDLLVLCEPCHAREHGKASF